MPLLADRVPRATGLLPVDEHLVMVGAEFVGSAHWHRFERILGRGLALAWCLRSSLGVMLDVLHADIVIVVVVTLRLSGRGGALLHTAVSVLRRLVRQRTCHPLTLGALPDVDAGVFGGPMTSIEGEEDGNREDISSSMLAVVPVLGGIWKWWLVMERENDEKRNDERATYAGLRFELRHMIHADNGEVRSHARVLKTEMR